MPSWIPGSYLLREFARHVVGIRAESRGHAVPVEQIDHSAWRAVGADGELALTLEVHALDRSVRGAWLDLQRGYFNGTSLFPWPEARAEEPVELCIEPPEAPACAHWRVASAMQAAHVDERGFGIYRAERYDELVDHPVEMGDFSRVEFEAGGVAHHLVVAGRFDSDLDRVAADLRKLCETLIDFFGRPPPFDRYWFLGYASAGDHGGLEHRASCSLIFDRDDLPKPEEPGVPSDYQRFLALASHEYFHAWHVKRIIPAAFVPYRLDRRNHTRLLWVFEGITSYYQDLFLLHSGLIGPAAYLKRLGEMLTRVFRTPGRFRQTLADSSFNAWDMLYKPEANSANTAISYYAKGAMAALALDLTLRTCEAGVSLDDVMRELWRRHGATGIGVTEDGFEQLASEVARADLTAFFDSAIRGTDDLPLVELLARAGVALELRPRLGPDDKGGTPGGADPAPLTLGASYRSREGGLELTFVREDGPAERAGLEPGDVLIALDRLKVRKENLRRRLARFEAGERVTATVFRGDELLEVGLVLCAAPSDTCWLRLVQDAEPGAAARRKHWLGA